MRRLPRFAAVIASTALIGLIGSAGAAPAGAAPGVERAVRSASTAAPKTAVTAPVLVDPIVWRPSETSRTFTAPANRDVLIEWPDRPLDVAGGFEFAGGRNVVSRGGIVKPSKRYVVTGFAALDNRCLRLSGNLKPVAARTFWIEGFHCAGQYVWEGINFDAKAERSNVTLRLRNIVVDQVNVIPGAINGGHDGGDAFHTWNGPHHLDIDGFRASNLTYQGFFLQPYVGGTGALGTWTMSNVTLTGAATGHGYLLWLAGTRTSGLKSSVSISLRNFVIRTAPKLEWKATRNKAEWPDVTVTRI